MIPCWRDPDNADYWQTRAEELERERDEARAEVDVLDKLMRQHRTASVGTIDRLEETEAELREEIRRLNDEVFALRRESLRLATDLERAEARVK